jgi:hypothetical protein
MRYLLLVIVCLFCCCGMRGPITIRKAETCNPGETKYYLQHNGLGWRGSFISTEKFNVGDTIVFVRKQDAPGER